MTSEKARISKPRFKKRWAVLSFFILMAVYLIGAQTIPRFPFGPFSLYSDLTEQERAETIPYKSLTDESSYPFASDSTKRNHEKAIRKFPTVRDCLVKSEAQNTY